MPVQNPLWSDMDTWSSRLTDAPGVYKIIALGKNGRPNPLSRVGGVDKSGVLYIGRSGTLRHRLKTLRRMLFLGAERGAVAGLTYMASLPIQRLVPRHQLAFQFEHCVDCGTRERDLIRDYFKKFGEVPPLNGRAEFIVPDADYRVTCH